MGGSRNIILFMSKKAKQIEEAVIDKFAEKRKELGYSYDKVAQLTGLHRTSLSLIERKKIHPTLLVCLKISEALDLKLEELFKKNR